MGVIVYLMPTQTESPLVDKQKVTDGVFAVGGWTESVLTDQTVVRVVTSLPSPVSTVAGKLESGF